MSWIVASRSVLLDMSVEFNDSENGHKVGAIDPNDVVRVCRKFGILAIPDATSPAGDK